MPKPSGDPWDAIVIGSGIGGLACAASLAKMGHKVLVLEQHYRAGGLTQTFHRSGFTWDVGVHYLGEMGPQGAARRILDWLCEGAITFAAIGAVYDTIHFPGNFQIAFSRPQAALKLDLIEKFPGTEAQVDAFFQALAEAERAGRAIFARRAMPALLAKLYGLWHQVEVEDWWGRTALQALDELVSDPKLRAVLLAQRGNYGGVPAASSFGVHATVMRHYMEGAYYPVGGAKVFANALVPVVERAGGELRLRAQVQTLLIESGAVVGVELTDGTRVRGERVFSDIGARHTVGRLLPEAFRDSPWAQEILSFAPSASHVALYLGLEGDIRSNGATASNHWFHESWDLDSSLWDDLLHESSPPVLFVSFPTLKDPMHDPGDKQRHTAEIVAMTSFEPFRQWAQSKHRDRPPEYTAFKAAIERNMLAQFERHFPALAPMVVCHELSTPLSTVGFIGADQGASYGLEVSPRRFLSDSLRVRTPIPGLFLTGQDVVTPGVTGAMMAGVLAAAVIEPRVYLHLG